MPVAKVGGVTTSVSRYAARRTAKSSTDADAQTSRGYRGKHAFTIPSQTDQHVVRGDVGADAMTSLIVMRVGVRNTGKVETLPLL